MAKFTLQPNPTFKAKVEIPVPGALVSEVEFTFRFRDRDKLTDLMKRITEQDRVATVMEMATGWELSDEFNADNIRLMDTTYIGALERVVEKYWTEHTKALEKN